MKISYKWLLDYLPANGDGILPASAQKMAEILTSVGLEVESIDHYEEAFQSLRGVVIGRVLTCEKHPNADKLKVTTIDTGADAPLQIVCGAPNVEAGQTVVVATAGAVLKPAGANPFAIKKATIRGVESNGMVCSQAELGIGTDNDGILVLTDRIPPGMPASEYFDLYDDFVFEIGLTPNRMDAMSHLGVAKDVAAYLSHHLKKEVKVAYPYDNKFPVPRKGKVYEVEVADNTQCPRYSGIVIDQVRVGPSPHWLRQKLLAIGVKPINNVVDITNFVLHETGQPLHAFDTAKILGNKIVVQTLPEGTPFISLDGKERKLSAEDIMICDGEGNPLCIGGVFGGLDSGVSDSTTRVFLESAVFNPPQIRKTLLRHNLRTDASIRFEKGVDIGKTVEVLKRAALLIREICGGEIVTNVADVYPVPREKTTISLSNHYLKKISGKNYHPDTVKNILNSLHFVIVKEGYDDIQVEVPYSNPDITLPADVIEEIMRIDGLDNIEIPPTIQMLPAMDAGIGENQKKEKIFGWLNGNGFFEIFTNSITNSKYYDEDTLAHTVRLLNSLSEDLDIMRPSMLQTGLEAVAHNLNRKNDHLLFAEFGKTYRQKGGHFIETEHLALFLSGKKDQFRWNALEKPVDIYMVKGICDAIFTLTGAHKPKFSVTENPLFEEYLTVGENGKVIAEAGKVSRKELGKFSIKQPVYYLNILWKELLAVSADKKVRYEPISRFPAVERDLALLVDKNIRYEAIDDALRKLNMKKLVRLDLFDVYEGEKLGPQKKSLAIHMRFEDHEKTLTDKEVEGMVKRIIQTLENQFGAQIRNHG